MQESKDRYIVNKYNSLKYVFTKDMQIWINIIKIILFNGDTIRMIIGISWTITFNDISNLIFHVAISDNPSLTKAEIIAILTTFIMYPTHMIVNIYTDS